MTTTTDNNKRIAKNTMMLYIRMLLIMGVTLYTSRVVLNQLGVVDYGIYNVVGGIVVLFSFLTNTLQLASQRFFSYELGLGIERSNILGVFRSALLLHYGVAICFFLICQTAGLWFLEDKLDIPEDRSNAALWIFEISIITGILNIIRAPYNSLIIAYERMSAFAYFSIVEILLKLASVLVLSWIDIDKLILYAALVLIVTFIVNMVYYHYCRKCFLSCKNGQTNVIVSMKGMISFSGWMLLLGIANISATQGINFMLNVFRGVLINAAIGIANQVNAAVTQFVNNFQTALNPQLIKHYAAGETDKLFDLLFRGCRISFLLLLAIGWPIVTNIDFILKIWLELVPEYSAQIVVWVLMYALIDTLVNPIAIVVQASGDIKSYQLYASLFILAILPIGYYMMDKGCNPIYIFVCRFILNFFSLIWRVIFLKNKFDMNLKAYIRSVVKPLIMVFMVAYVSFMASIYIDDEFIKLIVTFSVWICVVLPAIYMFGLMKNERKTLLVLLKKIRLK